LDPPTASGGPPAEGCDLTHTLHRIMSLRFSQQKHGTCFFVTTTFKDWTPLGNIEGFYPALAESLAFCAEKYDASIAGYVLMPTHIHLVLFIPGSKLSDFMRDFKKYIAQKVVKDLKVNMSTVWKPRYDRVVIYTQKVLRQKLNYIHHNPVKSSLAQNAEDWQWSSARDYASDDQGPIPVWKDWAYRELSGHTRLRRARPNTTINTRFFETSNVFY
jgi:putative transposase